MCVFIVYAYISLLFPRAPLEDPQQLGVDAHTQTPDAITRAVFTRRLSNKNASSASSESKVVQVGLILYFCLDLYSGARKYWS